MVATTLQRAISFVQSLLSPEAAENEAFQEAMANFTPSGVTPTLTQKQLQNLFSEWWEVASTKVETERGLTLADLHTMVLEEKKVPVEPGVLSGLFSIFDEDKDGLLSFREWCSASSLFMATTKSDRLKLQFRVWDKGCKGYLSRADLEDVLVWGMPPFVRRALYKAVRSTDPSQPLKLTFSDLNKVLEGIEFENYCFQVLRRLDRLSTSLSEIHSPIRIEIGSKVPPPSLPAPAEIREFFSAIGEQKLNVIQAKIKDAPHLAHGIRNNRGYTPVHHAAELGFTNVMEALLPAPDSSSTSYGAVNANASQLIHDSLTSITTREGRTPLMVAAASGHLDCVSFLLGLGADVSAQDFNSLNATQIAASKGQFEVAAFLQKRHGSSSIQDMSRWLGNALTRSPTGPTPLSTSGSFRGLSL